MNRENRPTPALDFVILTLALVGFAINLFLLVRRYSDAAAAIAGCGGGSCEEVLASRWSAILGVPVTAFGALVYIGLMSSLAIRFKRLHEPLLGMIAGAACWFVFVQAVLFGKFCPWCMAAHAVGIAVVAFGVIRSRTLESMKTTARWAVAAFLGIGLAQVCGPVQASHRIDDLPAVTSPGLPSTRGQGRKVSFDGGRRAYDASALPRRGPVDAEHVMVEYFDYQCAACRTMAGYLEAFAAKHPKDVAILLLPVPLDGVCNEHMSAGNQHPGSCEIARSALAVWRLKPEAFPVFHRALIADPSPESAKRLALELVAPAQFAAALSDPWIGELIQSDIADWRAFSKSTDKLPKLLIRDKRILHGLPSGEADFIRVMEKELGL